MAIETLVVTDRNGMTVEVYVESGEITIREVQGELTLTEFMLSVDYDTWLKINSFITRQIKK